MTTVRYSKYKEPIVYLVESPEQHAMKIGWTESYMPNRLNGLQVGNPSQLRLVGTMSGTEADEQVLHKMYRHLRLRGEWFRTDHPDARTLIQQFETGVQLFLSTRQATLERRRKERRDAVIKLSAE